MKKAVVYSMVPAGLLALVGGLAFMKVSQFKLMAQSGQAGMQAEVVTSASVQAQKWEPTLRAVGSVAAYQGVTVTTESSGIISKIAFEAGTRVAAGDLLIKLDTTVQEAQLQAAEARAELARVNAERIRELFARNTTAKAELDSAEAQLKQATAEVASIQAVLAQKIVRAPFAGRLGVRHVNLGQFIDRGNPIVSLQSLDQVYVNFTIPQQQLSKVGNGYVVRAQVDAMPNEVFSGKVTAINADVDTNTRTVKVQATFANADAKLRPGMFVNVAVVQPTMEDVLVIPVTSVLYAPYGDSVFVIEKPKDAKAGEAGDLILRQQFVRLGKTQGDFVTITSGLKADEKVVSTGVFKLRNGMKVTIDNKLAPEASMKPNPGNS